MLKDITINFDVLELMLVYWESVASKDKMSEEYFIEIAKKPQMKVLYNNDFSSDSVRRVLSSISNREKLNNKTSLEAKFWNQNMRMMEDINLTHSMLAPIKVLNLSELKDESLNIEKLEIIFIPFAVGDYIVEKEKIYFNFFSIMASYMEDKKGIAEDTKISVLFKGKNIKDFVIDTIKQNY